MDELRLSESDMAELRDAFFFQAAEILENLPSYIMAVEENPDENDWKSLRRSFHTLKGDSKAMGFHSLSTFAHHVEDLIDALKDRETDRASIDLLLECCDAFASFLDRIAQGAEPDISHMTSRIEAHLCTGEAGARKIAADTKRERRRTSAFLRIEPERVDRIMNLVGELVIGRSMLAQINSDVEKMGKESIASRLYNLNSSFERTLSELQRSVMKVRMLPVDLVFRRFPRIVRDLSTEKVKSVRLRIEGEKTELDKGIVDVIGEPLLHIVRNAVDHGIEPPDERRAAGKPGEGLICMRAFHQGNQMVMEVEDDGRGIDVDRLKEKALQRGIIGADEAMKMNLRDSINLIFMSGLSTSESITEVSGRGVGMDIVRDVVESLRGIIDITSEKGRGTKFTVRLPLTLAIIRSILFSCMQETFALPLTSVTEIIRIRSGDLDTIGGRPVLRHKSGVVPLISMDGSVINMGRTLFILLVSVAQRRAGLITEKIIGEEELVIKALDENASTGLVSGASLLGNGSVVLILDPLLMIKKASEGNPAKGDNHYAGGS